MSRLTAQTLTKEEIDAITDCKLQWILQSTRPIKVILTGSAANYSMTECSDVDIVVIFNSREDIETTKMSLFQNRPRDDWPHDLLMYTSEEFEKSVAKNGGFCWLAAHEGRVLYERLTDDSQEK